MQDKVQQILNDLYAYDSSFKQYEAQLIEIITPLLQSKPDTQFDEAFAKKLKAELLAKAQTLNKQERFNVMSLFKQWKSVNKTNYVLAGLVALILIVSGFYAGQKQQQEKQAQTGTKITTPATEDAALQAPLGSQEQQKAISQVKKFASKEEFVNYLANAQAAGAYGYGRGGGGIAEERAISQAPLGLGDVGQKSLPAADTSFDRISQTNVQVLGIDEPDIVKTDGKNIYLSVSRPYYYPMWEEPIVPQSLPPDGIMPRPVENTEVIAAFPPKDLKKLAKIDKQGELLLYQDVLVVFSNEYVYGYNVKDAQNPKEAWKVKLENNGYLTAARLYNGKLYLVTRNYPEFQNPCPLKPLTANGRSIEIPCTEIYHPIVPVPDIATYNAFVVDPILGEINNKLSFVGSAGNSIVYMSQGSLYITYTYPEDQVKIFADFIKTKASDLFPVAVASKIERLQTYDISSDAKMVELQQILEKYLSSLDQDERVKKENELENRINDYLKEHKRNLLLTGMVKISLSRFEIEATGSVPGTPLNQFSLDEYKDFLRIATTVGGQGIGHWGDWRGQDTTNDVYVLDKHLKITGKIEDLGLTERIYSARFIEDEGFLVTFRQTDPFYVLDLSNVTNPKLKGELKIPGYSSYLHPLAGDKILGVGMEDSRVKLSLFDTSDPANPKELDKYLLNEYWSDVNSTHHAFLQDKDHQVFFLPGGQNGYVFSHKNDRLTLQKAVSQIQAKRALYIQDYLYIVGSDKIVVVDEKTWERVNEMQL